MRIISGALKGKTITFEKNIFTRPLKDSVRENIFNILNHSNLIDVKLKNSKILDLYSGVGSFGLESISRDAFSVTFVEQNKDMALIIKKNLVNLSIQNKAEIINDKIENYLNNSKIKKFDIIFFDPPFTDRFFIENLSIIKKKKYFNKKHLIIIHRESKSKDPLEGFMKIFLIKNYGRSKIIFGSFN